MRAQLAEFAPAKINLTLTVLGRRAGGYHELESLVVFARNVGDVVRLTPGAAAAFAASGPTAGAIGHENLVERAMRLVAEAAPNFAFGAIDLEKHLPVAGGVGGGSADAAAVLRLLQRANSERTDEVDWQSIARRLGADVSVCLRNQAALMTGVGELISPIAMPSVIHAVLVNPNVDVPADKTARVFKALGAPSLQNQLSELSIPELGDLAAVLNYAAVRENSLQAAATTIVPEIDAVLAALRAAPGCRLVRLSGAGPTCFGLLETKESAGAAAREIATRHPAWWVRYAALS